ncbi:MAG: nucleotide sugar dehydrogenase [Bryobacteraceae bacterium]
MKLSIIGLGKLGSPMAAVMAHKGHTVIGVDLNPAFVAALQQGRAPVNETGLAEMIHGNRERLTATQSFEEAILASEITFIIVPTPSGPDGAFSVKYVLDAAEQIGAALRKKNEWHLVALCSTVMPGATGGQVLPALEAHSGKTCGVDFGLCYNPEFIALGSVLHDMLNPDMILIGESDARSGSLLEKMYKGMCDSDPRIQRMNFVNAELTKISVNTYVTTKISYANMLAQMCETLPGAEVDVVTSAIGCDSRIGRKYLKGALGYGGPCFPRDNIAFSALARANGVPALLAEATDQINRRQVERLVDLVVSRLPQDGTAGVLGLSYKPDTEVVEESQGLDLVQRLLKRGIRVIAFDPAAMDNARLRVPDGAVAFAASAKDCAHRADVLAIMTPWSEFHELRAADMKRGGVLIDCWRLFVEDPPDTVAEYIALGCGPEADVGRRVRIAAARSGD